MFKNITKELIDSLMEIVFTKKKEVKLITILNRITYIDKNRFTEEEYKLALERQDILIQNLLKKIDEEPEKYLIEFFDYNQIILLKIKTKDVDTKLITKEMKIEYLFENIILKNPKYKKNIQIVFKHIYNNYFEMKNSLAYYKDNIFYNKTNIDVEDEEEIFEKKNKILTKLKQDLIILFLFQKNKIISKKNLNNFIDMYINIFKTISEANINNKLELETVKIWATGVRYIEVLIYNFKYKYENNFIEYKNKINKLCPNLRFL